VILLDTHVWVRWLDPQQKPLTPTLVDVIETADQEQLFTGKLLG